MQLFTAKTNERAEVAEILQSWNLPVNDIQEPKIQLYLLKEKEEIRGTGGLEIYGQDALIRSVAVKSEIKGTGSGKTICDELEQIATAAGIKNLYLLTTTASDFFKHRGYVIVDRESFPENIKQTSQFSSLCPVSAICMMKILQ